MIFAELRVEEAHGAILAHSHRLPDRMLKKGRVLSDGDVAALKACHIHMVTAVVLEECDLGEHEAARAVAAALAGANTQVGAVFSGRCTVLSGTRGLMVIDRDRLDRLNLVDEAVVVATVAPFAVVSPRQVVATVKIIPFGIDRRIVEACTAYTAAGGPVLRVEPFWPHAAALILTELPGTRPELLAITAASARDRLEALGSYVALELHCAHNQGAVERAVTKALAAGCELILIGGASATIDRRDVVPSGIVRAGGVVDHLGMPVDPGNLLLLGHSGPVPIIGMPGCCRVARLNGFDCVLRRVLAMVPVTGRDLMLMGAGGLLEDAPILPPVGDTGPRPPRAPRLAAILAPRDGDTAQAITAATEALLTGGIDRVVVLEAAPLSFIVPLAVRPGAGGHGLTADDGEDVALLGHPATVLALDGPNPDTARPAWPQGLAMLPDDVDGALLWGADCAPVDAQVVARLVAAFDPAEGRALCLALAEGRQGGRPLLVARAFFEALKQGMSLADMVQDHAEEVYEMVIEEAAAG